MWPGYAVLTRMLFVVLSFCHSPYARLGKTYTFSPSRDDYDADHIQMQIAIFYSHRCPLLFALLRSHYRPFVRSTQRCVFHSTLFHSPHIHSHTHSVNIMRYDFHYFSVQSSTSVKLTSVLRHHSDFFAPFSDEMRANDTTTSISQGLSVRKISPSETKLPPFP